MAWLKNEIKNGLGLSKGNFCSSLPFSTCCCCRCCRCRCSRCRRRCLAEPKIESFSSESLSLLKIVLCYFIEIFSPKFSRSNNIHIFLVAINFWLLLTKKNCFRKYFIVAIKASLILILVGGRASQTFRSRTEPKPEIFSVSLVAFFAHTWLL